MISRRVAGSAAPLDTGFVAILGACALALFSGWGAVVHSAAVDRVAAIIGFAGVLGAVLLATRPRRDGGVTRVALAWGAFLFWGAASLVLSGRPWASLVGEDTNLLGLLAFVAFTAVVLFVSRVDGESVTRVLPPAAAGLAAVEVVIAVGELATGSSPAGTLPNSTYLGETLVVLLPLLFITRGQVSRSFETARWILTCAGAVVLAASGSRVAGAIALVWLLSLVFSRAKLGRRARFAAAAAAIVMVAAGGLMFAGAELRGSLGSASVGQRPEMWRTALLAALERPLTGFGPDGFIAGGVTVTTPDLAASSPALVFAPGKTDPHNLLVWVLVSTGFVGLALFVWACVEVVLRWLSVRRDDPVAGILMWSLVGSFLIALTAPVTLHVAGIIGIALGALLGRAEGSVPAVQKASLRVALRLARGALPFALALGSLVFGADAATRMSLEDYGPRISPARAVLAQQASDLWPFDPHLAHLASLHWGWAAQSDSAIRASAPDLAAIRRAVAVDARDPFVALELARTLRFHGASDAEIESAFQVAFARWSLFPTARAEYAIFLAQRGRAAEAREQLAIATLVDPGSEKELAGAVAEARSLLAK